MPTIPKDDPITYLVRRRFPDAQAIGTMPSIGRPSQISAEYRQQRRAEIEAYELELSQKTAAELSELFDREKERERAEWAAKAKREEEARFFNRPDCKADFAYWSKAAYWSIEEALALSFGRDPTRVNWESIKSYANVSPFVSEYARQRTLLQRAVGIQQLADGNLPGFFLAWAKRNRFSYPPELEAAVEEHGHQIADWKSLYDKLTETSSQQLSDWKALYDKLSETNEQLMKQHASQIQEAFAHADEAIRQRDKLLEKCKTLISVRDALQSERDDLRQKVNVQPQPEKLLHVSVRRSMLKMILGMAKDKFNFKPNIGKSPAPQNITDALQRHGIKLDVDTVRTRLQEAAAEVDDETENLG